MKSYFKSKTMWFSFALGFVGLIQTMMEGAPLDPQVAGFVTIGIGAVTAVLRAVTTTPVGPGA